MLFAHRITPAQLRRLYPVIWAGQAIVLCSIAMADDEQQQAIADAIAEALDALDRTQGWLGAEVARIENAPEQ